MILADRAAPRVPRDPPGSPDASDTIRRLPNGVTDMMNFHTPNTSIVAAVRAAWPKNETEARKAYSLFITHCAGRRIGPTPGMATVFRLAVRLDRGRTVEEAAAREYLYRWSLALRSPIFGVPHTLGM